MHITHFIMLYGYWALFIGCLAEGETVTLLGGLLAHEGLLHFWSVAAVAALGGTTGDMLLYFIGRRYGTGLLKRFKKAQPNIQRANKMILRHPLFFVTAVRFMYGFRLVGPLMIGASRLSPYKFIIFNIIGAVIWSLIFVTLGYLGGQMVAPWLAKVDHHLKYVFFLLAVIVLVWLIPRGVRFWIKRRQQKK